MTEEDSGASGADRKLFSFVEKAALRHLMAAAVIAKCPDKF